MSQLMFEDIVDFVEDYPREFRLQFSKMKHLDTQVRTIIEQFHEKRQEVFDNPTQRASEKLERLKALDSEYLGKAEEHQIKKLQILKALKHAVTVVQRKISDSVEAHRQELRFEHPGAAERIEHDSRQLDIDQDATVKQLYKDLIPSAAGLSLSGSSSGGGASANQILTSLLEYVPTYFRSPGVVDGTQATAAAGTSSGAGGNNNDMVDETESLGSTTHGGRVRSDGYDDKGYEKKRGRGRPRRNKEDDGGASTLSGIDEDDASSPVAGYSGGIGGAAANSKGGLAGNNNDEEVWCFCKQPSFGFMVACDGEDCAIEWFHGDCVHVREEDMENVERWFCPMCREKLVQRHAGNVSVEALNNSNVDANERAQNAMETMSQATTTSSAAAGGGGKSRLEMLDDEASTSSVGESGFGSRKRKRTTFDTNRASAHHKKKLHQQMPNGKSNTGRPAKKLRKP